MSVRYLWNFKYPKICIIEVPDCFIERVVHLGVYLTKINCDPFFFLSCKAKLVEVNLDNPFEDKITAETDYKLISSIKKKKSFLGPKYTPEFTHDYNNLPWYERDLMRYSDWLKFKEMIDDPDAYFKKKEVVNFDIIHHECRGEQLQKSYKEHKTVVLDDVKEYSNYDKIKTLLAIFRSRRDDLWVRMIEYFKKTFR